MASKLNKATRNDSKIRASFIFYEFQSGKPIFKSYQEFCKKMGSKFVGYPEFEFWFQRFSAGNFDLDYDRSQEPEYRTLTDMPVHIFERICENLGNNYQINYRFILRNVCKSFRSLVDYWIPNFKSISIHSYTTGNIYMYFDNKRLEYKDENLALDDFTSVLVHPKLKIEKLDISGDEQFAEKLARKLGSLKSKIHVENVHLNAKWEILKRLLPFYQPETLKMVHIKRENEMLKLIEEIHKIDQNENQIPIRIMLSRMEIHSEEQYTKELKKIVKKLLQFSNLQYCYLHLWRSVAQWKMHIERLGAKIQTDRPDFLHYSIPNSNDFFEIEIQTDGIRIERKSA